MIRFQLFLKRKTEEGTIIYNAGYAHFSNIEDMKIGKGLFLLTDQTHKLSSGYPELKALSSDCVILDHFHFDGMDTITITDDKKLWN
ncbi:hypothetical protein Q5741_18550 [Paenibacillus sp. JX-17]|uniref:Uncharacterized protein n=1 Tax=Paenibacillus lacisoli TaxID=3064525 RepID=A0ABT9CGK2_9BACL|nr:hypothetical protein [Paenibacillus sp. JX-17]MDO7908404.1 hypothetical protein [Paenibacillus sp. JX-17]